MPRPTNGPARDAGRRRVIDGIKQIRSTANEGMGTVMIELDLGADARRIADEVKSNVDAITAFPLETEEVDHP